MDRNISHPLNEQPTLFGLSKYPTPHPVTTIAYDNRMQDKPL